MSSVSELHFAIYTPPDFTADEVDAAKRRLASELRGLEGGVEIATDHAPANTKSGTGLTGDVILTLIGSGGVAVTILGIARDWLANHKGCKLAIKNGDKSIEIDGIPSNKVNEFLSTFKGLVGEP